MSYKGTETFLILVKDICVASIVNEWVERKTQTDIRLRRAKTKEHTVFETKDLMFAYFIHRHNPECPIHIRK